jgi:hypothetical protein
MSLRKKVLLLAAAVATATLSLPAHAQLAVYGTVTGSRLTNLQSSPEAPAGSQLNNSVSPLGGTLGAYYDFKKLGPVKLGADLRGSLARTDRGAYTSFNGGGTHLYSGLAGIRAVFHTPFVPLHPYIQGSAGIGRTDYGILFNRGITLRTNFQYEAFAGVDLSILPILDFRVVEFGYGGLNPFGSNSNNYPIQSVSSGLVFRLPF